MTYWINIQVWVSQNRKKSFKKGAHILGLSLPKILGYKNMNVSIFDTFTDSPWWDHLLPLAGVNRLENCQTYK